MRELFEALVELTPAVATVRSVADTVEQIATRGAFIDEVREPLAAIRAGLDATSRVAEGTATPAFDRVSSQRAAGLIAQWIDKLFIHCVEQMSQELRKLPVAGLKQGSRRWRREVARGLAVDQQADRLVAPQGASMHERKQQQGIANAVVMAATLIAAGLMAVGCHNYGGSVPIDDTAGVQKHDNSVNGSVPIDDDAGMQRKDAAPKP